MSLPIAIFILKEIRAAADASMEMSAPRLAATVILARPSAGGFELYMTRRSPGSGFAPDAYVFPGGTVDPQDGEMPEALRNAAARELFEEACVRLDPAALTPFSHWITPPSEPRRYDTHFFFAQAPPDQVARADAFETHDGIWISPAQALQRYRERSLHLVYPTIKHLERLLAFTSVGEIADYARAKAIHTICPDDSGDSFRIPPELENAW
ncbi:MAG TPA: NUDIX hydrolase [Candidatus Baltobacteraceae bacterium]|jgi:8-oxo-dGTP pyrophosphatase MutT (NUDIX family)|nr:NUDIX hydrolase [Candidatus Baltobacteraceae bacterium]